MRYIFIFGAVLFMVLSTSFAFAHGTGVSYEENKDGYKIDIGHDEFIAAGESTRFDFAVYPVDFASAKGDVFSDVWVTVIQDKKIFFAGGIHKPVFGTTGFTYVFPKDGTYTISARFQKDGETVVKTEFPFTVIMPLETKKETNPYILPSIIAFLGFIVGGAVGLLGERLFFKKKPIT